MRLKASATMLTLLKVFQFTHPGRGATRRTEPPNLSVAVSIHAPREGCDAKRFYKWLFPRGFQFTHPGRGATLVLIRPLMLTFSFNSRTPGGVRRQQLEMCMQLLQVSIHAPREGCDASKTESGSITPVSIHAPREGCDFKARHRWRGREEFQFTHPGRGAT